MAIQLAVSTRNARLDAIETDIGTSPILKIWTGSMPASCAAADTGTQLASPTLPSDWMAAASGGSKAMLGTWEDTSADGAGTAGYFRIYVGPGGTVCKMQGTVTATGGGGDLTVNNAVFAVGQDFIITSFTLTDANA